MRQTLRRIVVTATAAALGSAALVAAPAAKHTHLKRSEPMADSTVQTAPTAIRLWFSEPVQIAVTSVRVSGAGTAAVEMAAPRMGPGAGEAVIADVNGPIAPGRYSVAWRTMSRDGHPVSGAFAFAVAAPAAPAH